MGDSVSSLPDKILGEILSLVPTKVAASTSVLSKRWRNLLPLVDRLRVTELNLTASIYGGTVVNHASIKRLVIVTPLPDDTNYTLLTKYFESSRQTVRFQAPAGLVCLDYSSFVYRKYVVDDLDSLVEARLSLKLWWSTSHFDYDDGYYYDSIGSFYFGHPRPPIFGDVTCLVTAIRNITTLHLSPDSLEVFHFCCKSMPMFNNVVNLSIESNKQKGWQVMPLLFKSCPILQTLVFKGLVHKITNRCGDAFACNPQNPNQQKRKKIKRNKRVCCLQT
ncbi:F-box/RNI-like/FBD-like domains-containing protein [Raphanus sativus]|nr:F-box/RNI-like/FBD-like domains-containing protein [Raphanus sativus]